jgi:dipeptidyl aminopeptidase/acylaminoacyl peptidase
MRLRLLIFAATLPLSAQTPQPFTLQQILSAPYASELTAAPVGNLFAWVEDTEGRHNLWVGGPSQPARPLTHNTEDDGQDITQLAWSPDAQAIAYTYGAVTGADGRPANPAHLQHATPVQIILQPLAPDAQPIILGEGRSPLFEALNHHLFFIHTGQIWSADLGLSCNPSTGCSLWMDPKSIHQLVYDRGTASHLTLSPDGHTLAFLSRRTEANEPAHILLALFDLTTHTLTFPAPSTGNDLSPAFSPDGKQLAWLREPFTAANTPEYATNRVSANPWSIQLLDLTGTCHPELREGPASPTCTRTLFTPEPNQPGSVLPHMSAGEPPLLFTTTKRLIFASEADGYIHLYQLDPQHPSSKPMLLTPKDGEIEDVIAGPDGTLLWSSNRTFCEVAGYTTGNYPIGGHLACEAGGRDLRHLWRVDDHEPEALTHRFGIETHPQIAPDGTIAALASDAYHPMQPGLLANDDMRPLLPDSASATYSSTALVTPQPVLFDASDGLHLHAQLFLPKREAGPSPTAQDNNGKTHTARNDNARRGAKVSTAKHPAILYFHGGPHRQMLLGYPPGEYYSNAYAFNQYLASRGFIVLSVNYRGGTGYGLDFRQCEHCGPTGAAEYEDVLAARRYLASRPDVDAKRIGVWGGSYGGYLTALALARNSDLFAAGVDFHGVHDWNFEDNAADWKRGTFAEQDALGKLALASSPLADISHWTSPILLIHGDNDPDVAYAQTPVLADKLRVRNTALPKDRQTPVEELIFPDETHNFLLHRDWLTAYSAAAAFFERTLKP